MKMTIRSVYVYSVGGEKFVEVVRVGKSSASEGWVFFSRQYHPGTATLAALWRVLFHELRRFKVVPDLTGGYGYSAERR